jgi:hypothetical protein
LQVHSEIRLKKNGEIAVSNPSVGLGPNDLAASAVVSHRYDEHTGEHIIRLEEPLSHDRREDALERERSVDYSGGRQSLGE